jgi:hypothetical protein
MMQTPHARQAAKRPFKTAGAIVLALACLPAPAQNGSSPHAGVYRIAGTVVNAVTGEPAPP